MSPLRLCSHPGTLCFRALSAPPSRLLSTQSQRLADGYPNALPQSARSSATSKLANSVLDSARRDIINELKKNTSRSRQTSLAGETMDQLRKSKRARDMERMQYRKWKVGDVYAPHDLSPAEQNKIRRPGPQVDDPFLQLGVNPLDMYKNFSVMAEFCTSSMRIKPRWETGLTNVNQRKLAKAVRRAIGMGLMPAVHTHPEILERDRNKVNERWARLEYRGT